MHQPPPAIPDYELVRQIGRGSYGEVWLARSVTGLYRAIKIIYRDQFEDDRPYDREFAGIKRFEPISRSNESQVDVLHVGRNDTGGYFYYVMELADDAQAGDDGTEPFEPSRYVPKTLKAVLAAHQRLTVKEALPIGIALADALAHLHAHSLVHRDIKPSNIIFVQGRPKLADIGLVSTSDATRSFVGTEGFVPREGPGSAQADIFALGKVLYELSTGRDRREFPSLPENLESLPDRAELGEFNEVLLKACDPDPKSRYESAADLKHDLELLRAEKSVRRLRKLERTVRRGRKLALAGSVVTLIAALGWYQSHRFNRMAASQLAGVYVKNGQDRLEQNDWIGALPWFARALELESGLREREELHLLRIANTVEWCPQVAALYTHSQPVHFAFFDAEGARALLCDFGTTAQIWDPLTDQPLTPKLEHGGQPFLGEFSPDGSRVVTLSRGEGAARLWDTRTGALLGEPIRHGKQVNVAAFSPDGRTLATAGADGMARVWRAEDGLSTGATLEHGAPISLLAFGRGNRLLTGGGANATATCLRIWDTANGRMEVEPIIAPGEINAADFNDEGESFVTGNTAGEVCLWSAVGAPVRSWSKNTGHPILRVSFNHGDTRVLVASEWSVSLLNAQSGEVVGAEIQSPSAIRSAEFSPDGSRFVLAGESRTALIYDSGTCRPVIPLIKHGGEIYRAFFVEGGKGWITASADGTVRRWHNSSGNQNEAVFAHEHPLQNLFITSDSRAVITVDEPGTFRRWALSPDVTQPKTCLTVGSGATAAALSSDGENLVSATRDGSLVVLSANDFRMVASAKGPDDAVVSVEPNPRQKQAALVTERGTVWLWDWSKGVVEPLPGAGKGSFPRVSFSADGRTLAIAAEREVRTFQCAAANRSTRALIQHRDRIRHIGFGPEPNRLLVSSEDRVMRWWDAGTGKALTPAFRGDGGINFAEFSPDQRRVFTSSANYDAMIWNTVTGEPATPPFKPRPGVTSAVFSADGKWLALASKEGTLQVWDVASGQAMMPPLRTLENIRDCRFSPNSRWILTVEGGRRVVARPFVVEPGSRGRALEQATLLSGYRVDRHGFLQRLDEIESARLAKQLLQKSDSD